MLARLKTYILLKYLKRKKRIMLKSNYPAAFPMDYSMELLAEIRGGRNKAVLAHHGWWVAGFAAKMSAGDLPGTFAAAACPDDCDCDHLEELLAACKEVDQQNCAAAATPDSVAVWLPILLQYLPVLIELLRNRKPKPA